MKKNTMVSRRQAFTLGMSGALTMALAACGGAGNNGASADGGENVDVTV